MCPSITAKHTHFMVTMQSSACDITSNLEIGLMCPSTKNWSGGIPIKFQGGRKVGEKNKEKERKVSKIFHRQ